MDCKAYWRATELRAMGKSNLFPNLDSIIEIPLTFKGVSNG